MIQIDRANYGSYVEAINKDNTNCSYGDTSVVHNNMVNGTFVA